MKTSSLYLESLLKQALHEIFAEAGEHPKVSTEELAQRAAARVIDMKSQAAVSPAPVLDRTPQKPPAAEPPPPPEPPRPSL